MPISPKDLMKAKLQGVRSTLDRTPAGNKKNQVSLALAQDFNDILQSTEEHYPELKSALPAKLSTRGKFASMGVADLSFLDLEALCEQMLNLLALADEA